MKIWWQSSTPIHRLNDYRNSLTDQLNSIKRADTEIDINGVDNGSMDLHYNAVVAMNSFAPGGVLNKIMQAGERGYDAVAIGCFLDPAMTEAREVVKIPVFGLGETSMMVACMYGQKFSGVAFHAKQAQYYDRKAFEYGLTSRHVPFGDLGIDFTEVQKAFVDPGADDRALHQGNQTPGRAGRRGGAGRLRHGQRHHPAREDHAKSTARWCSTATRCCSRSTEAMAELKRDIGLVQSRRLLYQGADARARATPGRRSTISAPARNCRPERTVNNKNLNAGGNEMIGLRKIGMACSAAALALLAPTMARAEYPERQVTMIVCFGAGGGTDIAARLIANRWPRRSASRWWSKIAPAPAAISASRRSRAQRRTATRCWSARAPSWSIRSLYVNASYDPIKDFVAGDAARRLAQRLHGAKQTRRSRRSPTSSPRSRPMPAKPTGPAPASAPRPISPARS